MLGSLVSHGELDPEHGLVPGAHGSVVMDPGQPHRVFFIAVDEKGGRNVFVLFSFTKDEENPFNLQSEDLRLCEIVLGLTPRDRKGVPRVDVLTIYR